MWKERKKAGMAARLWQACTACCMPRAAAPHGSAADVAAASLQTNLPTPRKLPPPSPACLEDFRYSRDVGVIHPQAEALHVYDAAKGHLNAILQLSAEHH